MADSLPTIPPLESCANFFNILPHQGSNLTADLQCIQCHVVDMTLHTPKIGYRFPLRKSKTHVCWHFLSLSTQIIQEEVGMNRFRMTVLQNFPLLSHLSLRFMLMKAAS